MAHLAYRRQAFYRPRPISKDTWRSLVASLSEFKAGLETSSREIRAQAIAKGQRIDRTGEAAWMVIEPFGFGDLESVHFALRLHKNDEHSCELYVEFRKERILLSVSDIGTEWGASVFDEMQVLLAQHGISHSRWEAFYTRVYSIVEALDGIILTLAVLLYIEWRTSFAQDLLIASIGLFIAGATPAVTKCYRLLIPARDRPVLQVQPPKTFRIPVSEMSALLGLLQGMVWVIKVLSDWLLR